MNIITLWIPIHRHLLLVLLNSLNWDQQVLYFGFINVFKEQSNTLWNPHFFADRSSVQLLILVDTLTNVLATIGSYSSCTCVSFLCLNTILASLVGLFCKPSLFSASPNRKLTSALIDQTFQWAEMKMMNVKVTVTVICTSHYSF